ncbi:sodium/hydrogen exchanger 9B2 isoform X2 [Halyomorpha halys]|uniref:sodium/hydrogen exchanger 9B2 isoform X2 n=1 Tax=Halyomorpha halys TaxID=286706 RepID=UPI0006D4F6C2|nr:sodium/hydrogen exchanger 9B2-like isoform X2 [Halyomorpha halys]
MPFWSSTTRMGWYQQMRSQFGLHDNGLIMAATILFILAPALLLPSLLVSSAPLFLAIPPLAWVSGHLCELVGLPPTPMMLVVGMAFRALGWFEPNPLWRRFTYISRYIAVATVLTKSGLALADFPNIFLVLIPCTAEAAGIALLSYFFLGYPWLWGLAYGYAVSTASSSVNAEKLAQLKAEGYGPKEIYQLIFPASTVENIYSITGFAVCVAMIFSEGASIPVYIQRFPVAVASGLLFAFIWGSIIAVFPHRNHSHVVPLRCSLLVLGSVCVYLGAKQYDVSAGGPLGALATGCVSAYFWRSQGWTETNNPVLSIYNVMWNLLEAVLFGFVGAEVDVHGTTLQDLLFCGGFLVITISIRLTCFAACVALKGKFNWKEVFLGTLVWLPKATVLAALSPQVIDMCRKVFGNDTDETSDSFRRSKFIILSAVFDMIITAPVSYIIVNSQAPKLLRKPKVENIAESKSLVRV